MSKNKALITLNTRRGIFPGRFQPPHKGHGKVIKWALNKVDELIIAIGTAQESHTLQNPFTAGERIVMLKLMLDDLGIDYSRIYLIPVPDIFMNKVWVRYLEALTPKFHVAITRNPLVAQLFSDAGYEVMFPPPYNRDVYRSTHVRRLIIEGGNWKELLTPSVAKYIEYINGVERLRLLLKGD